MNTQTRISLVIGLVVALAIGVFLYLAPGSTKNDDTPDADASPVEASTLVREDSHVLGEEGTSDVTLVEFLDYQCPSCAAMHPVISELREKYEGKVTFVLRQFPLSGHPNAHPAAVAAEAAARQGKLDEMSDALFGSQAQWSPLSGDAVGEHFRTMAEKIGLDVAQYDADIADDKVLERVKRDVADGTTLGVSSTPTLFLNGERLEITQYSDVADAIDEALGSGVAA